MSLRFPENPKELRTVLHMGYEQYAQGNTMFPKVRLAVPAETLSRKTQGIAMLLEQAWARIEEDDAFFKDAANVLVDKAFEKIEAGEFGAPMLAITLVGRHCVKMATVTPMPDKPEATIGIFPRQEFVEQFDGLELNFADGRTLALRDGVMQGEFDAAVVRGSNVSGIMLPLPPLPKIEDVPVGSNV